jgi:hypothetical protein
MVPSRKKTVVVDRRRHPRWGWDAQVQGIYVNEEGRRVVETLQAVDISRCGLGAVGKQAHLVGQHIVVGLPEPTGRIRYVHARVVRCWQEQDGPHIGMEFSKTPENLGYWLNLRLAA